MQDLQTGGRWQILVCILHTHIMLNILEGRLLEEVPGMYRTQ